MEKERIRTYQKIAVFIATGLIAATGVAFGVFKFLPARIHVEEVGHIRVSGLSAQEVSNKINNWWQKTENETIHWSATTKLPDELKSLTPKQLGISPNVEATLRLAVNPPKQFQSIQTRIPIVWNVDIEKAKSALKPLTAINKPAIDAKPVIEGGSIIITKASSGLSVDIEETINSLKSALNENSTTVTIAMQETPPAVTEEQLKESTEVMGEWTTTFNGGQYNRSSNIGLACKNINGLVILPGGTFSYNGVLGPRSTKNGFRTAPVLINGKKEMGIGGGICQVSSTLFNAALMADMKIVERVNHSIPSSYIPSGRDATVDYPSADLKFTNTSDKPIVIVTYITGNKINAKILGKRIPNKKIEIKVTGHSYTGFGVKRVTDSNIPEGKTIVMEKGRSGLRCTTWRYVYMDGKLSRKEIIANSYYPSQSSVVAVGTGHRALPADIDNTDENSKPTDDAKPTSNKPAGNDTKPNPAPNLTPKPKPSGVASTPSGKPKPH